MRWKESSAIIIYDRSTLLYDLQTQNQRTESLKQDSPKLGSMGNFHGFLWGQFACDLLNVFIQYLRVYAWLLRTVGRS